MTLQWLIIAVLVAAAGIYLYRMLRRTLKAPFCSDCAGCDTKKLMKLLRRRPAPPQIGRTAVRPYSRGLINQTPTIRLRSLFH